MTTKPFCRKSHMEHLTTALYVAIVSDDEEVSRQAQELGEQITQYLSVADVELCKKRATYRIRKHRADGTIE
jgi:hypothetical protein